MLTHGLQLVVLPVESHIPVVQVNSVSLERNKIICLINKCCGVFDEQGGQLKTSLFYRAMRATRVSLNAAITPPDKERRLHWTTYFNLLAWFMNFRVFLLKKRFCSGGRGR